MQQERISMSKQKKLYIVLVVLAAVVVDIYLALYQVGVGTDTVNLIFNIESNKSEPFQIFYNEESGSFEFTEENSQSKELVQGKKEKLSFQIACKTNTLRMDFGTERSEVKIYDITVKYGRKSMNIPVSDFLELLKFNDLDLVETKDDCVVITAAEGDPYAVMNLTEYDFLSMVKASKEQSLLIKKIIYAVLVNAFAVFMIINTKKVTGRVKKVLDSRKLIQSLALNDFKTQFAGSYLGVVWALVQPIVTVLVYWFVFQVGLRNGNITSADGKVVPFVLWLMAGLVPWFYYQDALNGGTICLIAYNYLVKKVVFNIDILPIVKVLSSIFVHGFFVLFMLCVYALYGFFPDWYTLQIIYYSFCILVLVLGLAYFTSAVVVFFRDLTQIINIILQVQTWLTPIMWNIDSIKLNPVVRVLIKLNPMFYIVNGYRDALINKMFFWERLDLTVYFWCVVAVCFMIGTSTFRRLKIHFADVL
jgi:teichoic acid transport system permease protein